MAFQLFGSTPGDVGTGAKAGDNQFGPYGTGLPGVVPSGNINSFPGQQGQGAGMSVVSGGTAKHGDITSMMPMDPWLSSNFFDFLQSQIGQGATPYNLSTGLPSQNGAMTNPGQMSAPLTPILQQLSEFYQGKNVNLPGASGFKTGMGTLEEISKSGIPVDQMPVWQAMIDAQQRNISQNEAGMREQFASLGNLKGSPFGQATSDYRMQTAKDQNALLAQMVAQASENAAGRRLNASGTLTQAGQGSMDAAASVGQMLQGLDQSSIDRMVQEFIRTRPEYSPYLNLLYGAATTFPPYQQKGAGGGAAGGIAGAAGSAFGSAAAGPLGGVLGKEAGKGAGVVIKALGL